MTGELENYEPATVASGPVAVPEAILEVSGPEGPVGDGSVLAVGDETVVTGTGWAPGSEATVELRSDVIPLASGTAGSDGAFHVAAELGAGIPTGGHTLAVLVEHGEFLHEVALEVAIEARAEPEPEPEPYPRPGPERAAGERPGPPSASAPPSPEAAGQPRTGELPLTGAAPAALVILALAALASGTALGRYAARR